MHLTQTQIAVSRFGFEESPDDHKKISQDPRGWLKQQLISETADATKHFSELMPTYEVAQSYDKLLSSDLSHMRQRFILFGQNIYAEEAYARTAQAITTESPFFERLVQFWSNHFAVSSITTEVKSYRMKGYVGAFERDAIRPYVLGNFSDMLLAVEHHPAILIYLDNELSVASNLKSGKRGLNENLAREVLELHTLGVNGGYSQNDVIELAKIISGWSVQRISDKVSNGFSFEQEKHEKGDKTLLGKTYVDSGESEGINAFLDLAKHPSTAQFIAYKLARYFVSDKPKQQTIDFLADSFTKTQGDLKALSLALIDVDEMWDEEAYRIKQPNHYIISAVRAIDKQLYKHKDIIMNGLMSLGQYPFRVPSPAGYPSDSSAWNGAEAMMRRIAWAQKAATVFGDKNLAGFFAKPEFQVH